MKHLVYELDSEGRKLACRQLTDYTADRVRTLYPNPSELRRDWLDPERRAEIVDRLLDQGVDIETLGDMVGKPEADPFDLLCHLAFHAPLRTRRERAERLKQEETAFLGQYVPAAREVLGAMLDKYAEHGSVQFKLPDIPGNSTHLGMGKRHRDLGPFRRGSTHERGGGGDAEAALRRVDSKETARGWKGRQEDGSTGADDGTAARQHHQVGAPDHAQGQGAQR